MPDYVPAGTESEFDGGIMIWITDTWVDYPWVLIVIAVVVVLAVAYAMK